MTRLNPILQVPIKRRMMVASNAIHREREFCGDCPTCGQGRHAGLWGLFLGALCGAVVLTLLMMLSDWIYRFIFG